MVFVELIADVQLRLEDESATSFEGLCHKSNIVISMFGL